MACIAAALAAGCGGQTKTVTVTVSKAAPKAQSTAPPAARPQRGTPLASADQTAYRQILKTTKLLRDQAQTILAGAKSSNPALERGRAKLTRVHPRSDALLALQGAVGHAVDNLLGDPTRNGARAALKSTLAIELDLLRFNTQQARGVPAS